MQKHHHFWLVAIFFLLLSVSLFFVINKISLDKERKIENCMKLSQEFIKNENKRASAYLLHDEASVAQYSDLPKIVIDRLNINVHDFKSINIYDNKCYLLFKETSPGNVNRFGIYIQIYDYQKASWLPLLSEMELPHLPMVDYSISKETTADLSVWLENFLEGYKKYFL